MLEAKDLIKGRAWVLSKLEKPQAFRTISKKRSCALATLVMVARGDLGVELPPEEVRRWRKKRIVAMARHRWAPVIAATQMLGIDDLRADADARRSVGRRHRRRWSRRCHRPKVEAKLTCRDEGEIGFWRGRLRWVATALGPTGIAAWAQTTVVSEPATSSVPGDYRIAGTVVNAVTGEPVRRATVAVLDEKDSHTVESVSSDNDGHYALQGLIAAKYQLTASKRGFRTAFYDEHQEFSTAIVTGPDQDTSHLKFQLMPGAVLHGVVSGDGGDPVEGARVMLFLRPQQRRLGEHIQQADSTTTDDTGAYDFSNLAPGEYMVAVIAEPWYAMHSAASRGGGRNRASEGSSALDKYAYSGDVFPDSTIMPEAASATPMALAGGSCEGGGHRFPGTATPALASLDSDTAEGGYDWDCAAGAATDDFRSPDIGVAESAGFLDAMHDRVGGVYVGVAPGLLPADAGGSAATGGYGPGGEPASGR